MECQNCFRRASVHVTEISNGFSFELHFCPTHAREYIATDSPLPRLHDRLQLTALGPSDAES